MTESPLIHNQPEYTVSELSGALKHTLEDAFGYVRVRGEISGYKLAPSGHAYFTLKDANAILASVCWKGTSLRLPFKPEDGVEVICIGRVTTYAGRSQYQLVVEAMEPAGVGALMALLEKRKKQLAAEGLFDAGHKKPLPFLPQVIGVVTSPTGAVIRDILHRVEERFPLHVLLWPVLVQGEQAAGQIAAAIKGFNAIPAGGKIPRPDVLIVARGGGSLEDLWPFNEEVVVRAAYASAIPLISAVGHETDTTLIDYVADKRAPTPTAAAEIAVPVRAELILGMKEAGRRTVHAMFRILEEKKLRVEGLARGLPKPVRWLEHASQALDIARERLFRGLEKLLQEKQNQWHYAAGRLRVQPLLREIETKQEKFGNLSLQLHNTMQKKFQAMEAALAFQSGLLESYHYKKVLERGFALVRDSERVPVASVKEVSSGQVLSLEFYDGEVAVTVGKNTVKKAKHKPGSAPQPSLFE